MFLFSSCLMISNSINALVALVIFIIIARKESSDICLTQVG